MTKLNRLLWYGGDWHDSIDGELIDIKNPATGHAIGRTAVAGPRSGPPRAPPGSAAGSAPS